MQSDGYEIMNRSKTRKRKKRVLVVTMSCRNEWLLSYTQFCSTEITIKCTTICISVSSISLNGKEKWEGGGCRNKKICLHNSKGNVRISKYVCKKNVRVKEFNLTCYTKTTCERRDPNLMYIKYLMHFNGHV